MVGGVQYQNDASHVFMNITAERYHPRFVEGLGGHWLFICQIATKVEPFRRRIRKDIVVGVAQVAGTLPGPSLDDQKGGVEHKILLDDLFHLRRSLSW